jgi:hypothetical protein
MNSLMMVDQFHSEFSFDWLNIQQPRLELMDESRKAGDIAVIKYPLMPFTIKGIGRTPRARSR